MKTITKKSINSNLKLIRAGWQGTRNHYQYKGKTIEGFPFRVFKTNSYLSDYKTAVNRKEIVNILYDLENNQS